MREIFTAKDLRQRYRVGNVTLWRWVKDGKLPAPKYLNRRKIWTTEQIEQADRNLFTEEWAGAK